MAGIDHTGRFGLSVLGWSCLFLQVIAQFIALVKFFGIGCSWYFLTVLLVSAEICGGATAPVPDSGRLSFFSWLICLELYQLYGVNDFLCYFSVFYFIALFWALFFFIWLTLGWICPFSSFLNWKLSHYLRPFFFSNTTIWFPLKCCSGASHNSHTLCFHFQSVRSTAELHGSTSVWISPPPINPINVFSQGFLHHVVFF